MSLSEGRAGLDLAEGWRQRRSVTWRVSGEEISCQLAEFARAALGGQFTTDDARAKLRRLYPEG